jgi:predicted membrane channel-forming protein YqfA (hemolysin III family)
MRSRARHLPTLLTSGAVLTLVLHGPLAQPAHYNDFADQTVLLGIPHAADVLSNIGFAIVAAWGWLRLYPNRTHEALGRGWYGYRLFLIGLFLTALGSTYYHLAPDNQRLVWDRLPIALACAGLLAGVRAETRPGARASRYAIIVTLLALASVAWWHFTDQPQRPGDLGPYLLVQLSPLVLIPAWQAIHAAPRADRVAFGVAIALYVLAKLAELEDGQILATLGWMSGHTLKHLLATLGAGVLVARLSSRVQRTVRPPDGV